ncbi:ABC transporter permease [Ponticoccus sp. SC2-23]|uniref:ABC transporter permease n=1 Tax=Alexandriicola marinus TaxID=2081710 RepID=UPI000FD8BFE5|nr:ABC transporter permease [Alexandriicola marinus]MBM1220002.1 ABC transporter permease [Ponticoccus sp. SC6-9]MBM1224688.1 ABC transporter permease [Ponticoccus sp. SC6-15]MBM1228201.1 ABC transporter permease [Ponticoccus sp. SC6-38]MBM1234161.1 ABC transporter permease [Ponticoccus sp. SC6-45]MBM1238703.1 ABC transporter permease [Ponticoccus sp. SC6-49]MBM1242484.1 ABC transporter permease [Ponticoccus sp. SC2-64]MBM1247685.1 ABC transporter permease [Ponticoccus sp. SC6-42]MBM1251656
MTDAPDPMKPNLAQTTGPAVDIVETESAVERRAKEAYFTASQSQLIWARFKKQRAAMVAGFLLLLMVVSGLFAPFLSPYDPTIAGRNADYTNGAPQIPQFCDKNGCSLRPFIHGLERTRSIETNFRWVTEVDEDTRHYLRFFVTGDSYKLFGFIPGNLHLFGVDDAKIHLFGTDEDGQDIFSRTLHAIWTSLQVGTIGVLIAFVLALVIGGVAGYYGGWIDGVLQMITDAVRTVPAIPLFMAVAAFMPPELTAEQRFFYISMILGLIGWPTLARRVRTHLLTERNQEYVLAAQLSGASSSHVIRRHLLPSFTSYIIVDLVISFPYMVLSETALSFIGLGLKDPVSSLGVMLQKATSADVMLNYPWYFIPVIFFIILVMSFVFVGDGLRDAADPYSDKNK